MSIKEEIPIDDWVKESERWSKNLTKKVFEEMQRRGWEVYIVTGPAFFDKKGNAKAAMSKALNTKSNSTSSIAVVDSIEKLYDRERDIFYLYVVRPIKIISQASSSAIGLNMRFHVDKGARK